MRKQKKEGSKNEWAEFPLTLAITVKLYLIKYNGILCYIHSINYIVTIKMHINNGNDNNNGIIRVLKPIHTVD